MLGNEYIAGFLDGEGCISVYKSNTKGERNHYYHLEVQLSNTSIKILKKIQKLFGGTISHTQNGENPKWNPYSDGE